MRIVLSTFQTKDNLPSPHSHPPRFRRDVLEGTLEEMLEAEAEAGEADLRDERGNTTISERQKRQAEFPGAPEQDNTK